MEPTIKTMPPWTVEDNINNRLERLKSLIDVMLQQAYYQLSPGTQLHHARMLQNLNYEISILFKTYAQNFKSEDTTRTKE